MAVIEWIRFLIGAAFLLTGLVIFIFEIIRRGFENHVLIKSTDDY